MTEIDKMFENAGIKCLHPSGFCKHIGATCEVCERHKYPPFTAEKQLAILQTLIFSNKAFSVGMVYPHNIVQINNDKYIGKGETFGEALAEIINRIWQSLTDQEKKEIRNILNENS